ncbi:MAG TPA: hypothetical protein VN026_18650 [Bacteroidia bacterium]|jgi:hypothetical protein|nr:hypothetical protein [Bacteroidia bacterium]
MESFEEQINRFRDEIAVIKTSGDVEEDLNPKFDFIIAKSKELITLLEESQSKERDFTYPLSFIEYIPRHLTEIKKFNSHYIWWERGLNSQIEHLNHFLGDEHVRRVWLKIK